jgi:hypothetical protein
VSDWLLALGAIFGVNLLPAFGPPTWAVLVFFRLNSELPAVPLVLLGALAAASGRLVLTASSPARFTPPRRRHRAAGRAGRLTSPSASHEKAVTRRTRSSGSPASEPRP